MNVRLKGCDVRQGCARRATAGIGRRGRVAVVVGCVGRRRAYGGRGEIGNETASGQVCEGRSRILQTNPCRTADVTDGCCFWDAERSQRGSLALRAWCAAGASSQLAIRGSREQVDHYGACQRERMRIQRPTRPRAKSYLFHSYTRDTFFFCRVYSSYETCIRY